MSTIIVLIILFFFLFCAITILWATLSLAPWVPSRKKDLERIFKVAELKPGEVFYDLGCGNGRIIFYASKNFHIKSIGIYLALPLFLTCKIRQFFHPKKDIIFKYKSLFKEDLSKADVIYVFGLPNSLEKKLKQKLEKELKSGARVIPYCFSIKGLKPKIVDKPNKKDNSIYLYQF